MDILIIIIILVVVILICSCCSTIGYLFFFLKSSELSPAQTSVPAKASTPAQTSMPPRGSVTTPKSTSNQTDINPDTSTPPPTTLPPISTTTRVYNAPGGQNGHALILTTKVTVNDNPDGGFDVWINSPIEINHNVSIAGRWGGNVQTKIDTKWNITVTYTSPDGWINGNNDTVGRMSITTGLQTGGNVTNFEKPPNYQGYWKFAGNRDAGNPADKNVNVSFTQSNNSRKLTFRSKDDLLTISAEVRGYYYPGGYLTDTMNINIKDTLAVGLMDITTIK